MQVVPTRFFITSGSAVSPVSDLNAFDLALLKADLSEQNLVAVSSVIPDGASVTEDRSMPMGMVTFCVLSQCRCVGGEVVSAGIAYAYRKDGHGGYVAEGHLHGSTEVLKKDLAAKMAEMSRIRGAEFGPVSFVIETLEVPEDSYGCAVAALVFKE